jgi:multidrug efflux pump subunit AcrA (membrane-fusion protein)
VSAAQWVDAVGVLLGSGTVAVLYNWLRARRTAPTDNTVRLSSAAMAQVESAMRQVDQLQEQLDGAERAARDARIEADDCRRETAEARREMRRVTAKAEELGDRLDRLIAHIHDPYMTIERLRVMVPLPKSPS